MWVFKILLWGQNSAGDVFFFFFFFFSHMCDRALPALYNVWWFPSRWCHWIRPQLLFSVSCCCSTNMIMVEAIFRGFQKLLREADGYTEWILARLVPLWTEVPVGPPYWSGLKYHNSFFCRYLWSPLTLTQNATARSNFFFGCGIVWGTYS